MKLTFIVLLLGLVHATASVYSQNAKISIVVKGKPVIEALNEIENQTGYRFFYQDEQINVNRTVNLSVDEGTIDQVLGQLFHGQAVNYRIMKNNMILLTAKIVQDPQPVEQKAIPVTGIITDENNQPLPGVTVVLKNSRIGVVSDENGRYSFKSIRPDGILDFSFMGMESQHISIKNRSKIDVMMVPSLEKVDEVVVMGYGSQKAKNVTGSVVSVPVDNIDEVPVSNLTEALKNELIPGLSISGGSERPGESATMSIRQTFDYSKDGGTSVPLVVIDDVIQIDPETGLATLDQFNMLDPSEIESITVLRDASAAIYGSRASQGAIIVKTKRGKVGAPRISYSGSFAWKDAVSHTKTMSAYEYGVFANRFLRAAGHTDEDNLFSDDELEQMKSLDYDWLDKAWSPAFTQRHAINVSGGSDHATYFAGGSYYTQGANMGSQDYDKWTFRAGSDVNLRDNLKLSISVAANRGDVEKSFTKNVSSLNDGSYGSKSGGEQADYGYLVHMPKYIPWSYEIDGEEEWVSPSLGPYRRSSNQTSANQIGGWNYFALLDNGSKQTTETFSYSADFNLTYDVPFIKGLSVKGSYAVSQAGENTEQAQFPYTLALSTNSTSAGTHLYTEDTNWSVKENNKKSRVAYSDIFTKNQQMNLYLTYDRHFGKHGISAMTSIERSTNNYNKKYYLYESPEADTYNGTSSTAGTLSEANSYTDKTEGGTLSYLGRVNYDFADKYLFQFIFRADASTKFAPENYWGFFPTFTAGWVMSEEDWFKEKFSWADFFKVRLSAGKTGQDNIKAWKWEQTFTYASDKGLQFGSDGGTLGSSLTPDGTPNRDVHWDTDWKYNLGFDLVLLNNRLNVSMDFYYDQHSDMLITMTNTVGVPISIGGGYAEQNYAAINSWGNEMMFQWRDRIGSEFHYNIGISFGLLGNNKVKKYPEYAVDYPSSNTVREGKSTKFPTWGFKVWKGTSSGDGMLRTDEDIDNYWNYLTEHADAVGEEPSYLDITSKSGLEKGMLAYQDLYGDLDESTGELDPTPDGSVDEDEDYAVLMKANHGGFHSFKTKFGFNWKGLTLSTSIATSWHTYREIDVVKQGTSSNQMLWAHEAYDTDMFDEDDNPDGKYPNLAYYDEIAYNSDFWQLSGFSCRVSSLVIGYRLPHSLIKRLGINAASVSVSGDNLWYLNNPYPKKYRNMYDNSYVNYPTLRTWSMNVHFSF